MAKYFAEAGVAVGTDLPLIMVTGSAAIRAKIYEWLLGFSTSPADLATLLKLVRVTDAGTGGTSLTVGKHDPLTATATATAKSGTFSAAPTKETVGQRWAQNQRATHRWIAREGAEFISAAASNNGVLLNSVSSGGTPTCDATINWEE